MSTTISTTTNLARQENVCLIINRAIINVIETISTESFSTSTNASDKVKKI